MTKKGEYVDLYDSKKKLTGERIFREKGKPSEVPEDNYIIVVLAIIINSKGQYLFQKTSARKGGLWALSGGHVKAGQTSLEAIKEELNEELGIIVDNDEISLFKTYKYQNAFKDVYIIKKDYELSDFILEKDELDEVAYLSKELILSLIEEQKIRKTNLDVINDFL